MHQKHVTTILPTAAVALTLILAPPLVAAPAVGDPAPAFSGQDSTGQAQSLDAYKGRVLVLEWFNPECPFVRKHYDSHHMQGLQQTYTAKGVAWLMVASSAPGKQGYLDATSGKTTLTRVGAHATALILDSSGSIGRTYGAKTTPHMFIIDPAGKLIYAGGIDDKPSTDQADLARARPLVAEALDAALAGRPVPTPSSPPYGCSVKYAN
jgi:peroxiredoxin